MIRNLSITAKLLKRPDPGLAVKRRVRSSPAVVFRHVGDVSRAGTPPETPPGIVRMFSLTLRERAVGAVGTATMQYLEQGT